MISITKRFNFRRLTFPDLQQRQSAGKYKSTNSVRHLIKPTCFSRKSFWTRDIGRSGQQRRTHFKAVMDSVTAGGRRPDSSFPTAAASTGGTNGGRVSHSLFGLVRSSSPVVGDTGLAECDERKRTEERSLAGTDGAEEQPRRHRRTSSNISARATFTFDPSRKSIHINYESRQINPW